MLRGLQRALRLSPVAVDMDLSDDPEVYERRRKAERRKREREEARALQRVDSETRMQIEDLNAASKHLRCVPLGRYSLVYVTLLACFSELGDDPLDEALASVPDVDKRQLRKLRQKEQKVTCWSPFVAFVSNEFCLSVYTLTKEEEAKA